MSDNIFQLGYQTKLVLMTSYVGTNPLVLWFFFFKTAGGAGLTLRYEKRDFKKHEYLTP